MNILVTGGRGQLGCSLQKIADEYPDCNFVFTDMPEGDITDSESITDLLEKNRVDVVINCAAYTAVDRAESEPQLAEKINVEGVRVLARAARHYGVKVVHISTDYVFDGKAVSPIDENTRPNPTAVYGRTKYAGECALLESGVESVIIRTAWLYSEFGNNFLKTMLRLAGEGKSISVVDDQIGTPTYATDLARAIMTVVGNVIEGQSVYHFTDDGVVSWYGFAAEIFAMAGLNVNLTPISTAQFNAVARRPTYSVLDKSKIKSVGVSVPDWKESLEICIKELLKQ